MRFFLLRNKQVLAGTLVTLLLAVVLNSLVAVATLRAEELKTADSIPAMEPVVVVGTVEGSAIGKSTLDAGQIAALPAGNGAVEDLVSLMPGVQAGDQSNTSLQAGEIRSPLLSISGGRPYDNYFMIDGMGNNSLLDPGSDTPAGSPIDVPGHPEEIFLSTHLVKEFTVYDNNIPARYGGFTGGVVAVETIDPAAEFYGSVRYRTTRDSWTKFHVEPADQTAFVNSYTEARQPRFEKHDAGFDLNFPLSDRSGLLASYQITYSKIPLLHFGQTENQSRQTENYRLKYVNHLSVDKKLTIQGLYSPYTGSYFIDRTKDSGFTLRGGGSRIHAEYEQKRGEGHLIVSVGLGFSENSRTAPQHHRNWESLTRGKDWGDLIGFSSSREGGFGDIDKTQKTIEGSLDWLSDNFTVGEIIQQVNTGLLVNFTQGSFGRQNTSYAYKKVKSITPPQDFDPLTFSCGADSFACDGTVGAEQYFSERNVYQAVDVVANIMQLAVYLDDTINFKRLELRPGVRLSYDDFMENVNVAPRFAATYDLFDDGGTELIAGWNRYYTRTLLTYKLREAIIPRVDERSTVVDNDSEWSEKTLVWPGEYEYSRLRTPYADEIVLGLNQELFGGRLDLRYVRRDGDDEFAREKDPFDFSDFNATLYSRLNNNGESHYQSYRMAWERQWPDQYLALNATYSESMTTNDSYEDRLESPEFDPADRVWYDGKLLWPDELPRQDFNRPWVANIVYTVDLPYGVRFANVTSFRSGYKDIEDSGANRTINGTQYDEYRLFKQPSSTIFDWRVDWIPSIVPAQTLTLTLEILNAFNKRTPVGAKIDEYELGRQFWAGVEYRF